MARIRYKVTYLAERSVEIELPEKHAMDEIESSAKVTDPAYKMLMDVEFVERIQEEGDKEDA